MAYLIEILLPTTGPEPLQESIGGIRDELAERFGGATFHLNAPAEGFWDDGDQVQHDGILVVEVMADIFDRAWWTGYKYRLQKQLKQDEVVIRSSFIERA